MRARLSTAVAVLFGGTVAGLVDIGAASAINGFLDPVTICHVIAAGAIGRDAAMAGGMKTAALGLALQIAMSLLIAAIYAIGARFLPILRRHWLPAGLAFGVAVFVVMEFVVVPLSAIGHFPKFTPESFALNLLAMLVFGTIIAWFARDARRVN